MRRMILILALAILAAGCASTSPPPAFFAAEAAASSCNQLTCNWTGLATGNGTAETMSGVWVCEASGTWTGGGSLTFQTLKASGTWEAITGPAGLVGASADTGWLEFKAGQARYRPAITGTVTDVDLECRRVVH